MATQGPLNPATASGTGWTNPTNIEGSSAFAVWATAFGVTEFTNNLIGTNFGFSIPVGATIGGIQVTLARKASSLVLYTASINTIQLIKAGVAAGTVKGPGTDWSVTVTDETWGSSADLWGTTWTAAQINASNFGFQITALSDYSLGGAGSRQAEVQNYRITVTYTVAGVTLCQTSGLFGF